MVINIKYKCNYKNASESNVLFRLLKNRGVEKPQEYCNLTSECLIDYNKLDNMQSACKMLDHHICNDSKIAILVDEDVDGFTSASVMFNYLGEIYKRDKLEYIIHKRAKSHGLTEDVIVNDDVDLLIIPDAGSSNVHECKLLKDKGIDVIILDHHECSVKNDYAIVVNNMLSKDYSNKNLSGVGVVYKFCQALDEYYMEESADKFIDLVALGLIGDMMDIKSYETKYLIDKGLNNITNKFLIALINKQEFVMNGIISIRNFQFSIVPLINAMIRVGSLEEKELVFKAMINEYEEFEYESKTKGTIMENIYDRGARLCSNAKSRHDNKAKKEMKILSSIIDLEENETNECIIVDGTETVDNALTGVTAMKIASKYKKPCILLNLRETRVINGNPVKIYGGSARNQNNSTFKELKNVVASTGCFSLAEGHQGAFGVEISEDMIENAREKLNEILGKIPKENEYSVDFELAECELDAGFVQEIDLFRSYIGQGINETLVKCDLSLNKSNCDLMGKNKDSISYMSDTGVKYVMFSCNDQNELLQWMKSDNNAIEIEVVGKPSINIYQGIATPQFIIEDFNVLNISNTTENDDDIWEDGDDIW